MVNKIELRTGNNFLDMMNFLSLILGPLRILTLVPVKNFFLLEKWDKKNLVYISIQWRSFQSTAGLKITNTVFENYKKSFI